MWYLRLLSTLCILQSCRAVFQVDDFCKNVMLKLTKNYEDVCKTQQSHIQPLPQHILEPWNDQSCEPQIEHYLVPPVLLWDPLRQLPQSLNKIHCPLCSEVGKQTLLKFSSSWNDGHAINTTPRLLYCRDQCILLVSNKYLCSNGHMVSAHQKGVLKQIPYQEIPFILGEKYGITKQLLAWMTPLVKDEESFTEIKNDILHGYTQSFYCKVNRYLSDCRAFIRQQNPESVKLVVPTTETLSCPQTFVLMNCFVSDFMQQQDANIAAMSSIRGQTVVCHLIQMNYMIRQSYGKKNAYKYIFYMTNEHHQVLKWMFIKNKDKFAEFEEVFKDLDKRYHANHEQIELVVTTLCCEWKDMIRHCLQNSPNVKIQYSVFEFVQNICKHLPKEHPRYAEICQDINQVVQPIGEYNHGIQPSGQSMISKWNNFTLKYQGEAYQGKPICDFITTEEINIIEHHGQNGCLTEFSPGYEVLDLLNEKLKKIFQKKISLSLAYTLIFMTLHKWNSDKGVKGIQSYSEYCMLQTLSDTIGHRQSGLPLVDERFGLIPENVEVEAKQKLKKDASEFTVDDIEKIMEEIDSLLDRELHNDASLGENVNTLRDHSDYESMCSQRQYFTILSKMVKLWKTLTMVNKHAQDSLMCYHMCLSCEQSLNLTSIELADNEREIHDKRLERVAENWNMQVVPVQGDGNCLFTAVSMAVQGLQENGDMTHHLASLGLASNMEIPHMALRLRQLVVEEWTGQHGQQYAIFFPNINFAVEAERFLSSGTFGGELGNAMVLALSNVLQIPFVILSSVENWPVITVTPRSSVPSPNTLYLAFNQYGPGHYDCLVERSDVAEMTKAVEIKCNCGINNRKGEQEGNCCNSELGRRRRSRCPCLSRRVPCSRKCRCRNCGNLKPAPENSEGKRTRKRVKLSGEHILSNSKKLSKDLVAPKLQTQRQVGETSCVLDFCLLEAIHQSLQAEDLDCTAEALCNIYNAIFQWVQTLTVFIPLAEITLKKVNEILRTQQSKPSIFTLSLNG